MDGDDGEGVCMSARASVRPPAPARALLQTVERRCRMRVIRVTQVIFFFTGHSSNVSNLSTLRSKITSESAQVYVESACFHQTD